MRKPHGSIENSPPGSAGRPASKVATPIPAALALVVGTLGVLAFAPPLSADPRQREVPPWGRAPNLQKPDVARPDLARPDLARPDEHRPNAPRAEGRGQAGAGAAEPGAREPGLSGPVAGEADAADGKKPAWMQTEAPDTPAQRRRMLDDLYAHLAAVSTADEAVPLVAAIERLWLFTGRATVDVLMERVLKAGAGQKLELAGKLSDTIIELAPGYAEGWNRRALVAYLRDDPEGALDALRHALTLEPNHFKALDGVAQVMRQSGERKAALRTYQRLMDVHPFWDGGTEALETLKREVEGQGI